MVEAASLLALAGAAQRWVPMLLLATAGEQDAPAYARAFHSAFAQLDDVAAVQADAALAVEPATIRVQLAQALAANAQADADNAAADAALRAVIGDTSQLG